MFLDSMRKSFTEEELSDSFCIVIGTRPGIIKQAPVIEALKSMKADFFVLHTGQHYSYNMDKIFLKDLGLDAIDYRIKGMRECKLHGEQTGKMLVEIERILVKERPRIVIVTGDANTNLAGALAAKKLHIRVAHTESGVRTFDWRSPEEHNRILIERLSDYLFAPNEIAMKNLEADNVGGEVFVVGSTLVDSLNKIIEISRKKSRILQVLNLDKEGYFLVTIHREENLDYQDEVRNIVKGLISIARKFDTKIVFPAHPRTVKRLKELGLYKLLEKEENIDIIPALGYIDFISLLLNARLVLTDSGGVQQEACILKVPCVTLLQTTDWIETLLVGANILVGSHPSSMIEGVEKMLNVKRTWKNPFGKGGAGRQIAKILVKKLREPIEKVRSRYRNKRSKHLQKYDLFTLLK